MTTRAQKAHLTFLGTAFWVVGGFCTYWETQVFAAANRFGEIELAVLGKCSEMEAVIFTLTFFWLPLLILHLIAHQHQRLGGERPRFPGVMAELSVPAGMQWIRVLLFIALCLWPTALHVYLTGRAYSHYVIVPSGWVKSELDSAKWPAVRGGALARYPFTAPSSWQKGARWWVNSREEWIEIRRAESHGPAFEVKPQYERAAVSALGFQPLLFDLVAVSLACSSLFLMVSGFVPKIANPSQTKKA